MIGPAMRPAVLSALVGLLVAGCGSGGDDDARDAAPQTNARATTAPPQEQPPPQEQRDPGALPAGVPQRATGAADPEAAHVVRRWSAALRKGDVAKAASYFARRSKIQNASPVIKLTSRAHRVAFNLSLPCGAVPTKFGAAGEYTIVTFRLTDRVGGDCGAAKGNSARCAIRVKDGHITHWFRLADPPQS